MIYTNCNSSLEVNLITMNKNEKFPLLLKYFPFEKRGLEKKVCNLICIFFQTTSRNPRPRSKEITPDTFQILFAFGKLNRQIPCVLNYLEGSRDGTFKSNYN